MAKRYKVKVEVEFECPATDSPEKAFSKYFTANRKVEKKSCKLIESQTFSTPSKVNDTARAHNEARRILQVVLDKSGLDTKVIKGYRSKWSGGISSFNVHLVSGKPAGWIPSYAWFSVKDATINHTDKTINLADPNSTDAAVALVKCAFGLCGHQDKGRHV